MSSATHARELHVNTRRVIGIDVGGHAVSWRCYDQFREGFSECCVQQVGGRTHIEQGMSNIGRHLTFTCERRTRTSM